MLFNDKSKEAALSHIPENRPYIYYIHFYFYNTIVTIVV